MIKFYYLLLLITICLARFKNKRVRMRAKVDWANGDENIIKASNFFNDTMLIINFNSAYYENIPFLFRLWSPIFQHIQFYGPKPGFINPSKQYGHYKNYEYRMHGAESLVLTFPKDPDVNRLSVRILGLHEGQLAYRSLVHCMRRFPYFSGYLFTNDDVFLNWWQFLNFDLNKIWVEHIPGTMAEGWSWWYLPQGMAAFRNAYNALPNFYKRRLNRTLSNVQTKDEYFSYKHFPPPVKCMSDVVYVPHTLHKEFLEVADYMMRFHVFLEIAIPSIILTITESKKDYETLRGLYLWRDERNPENTLECYDDKWSYIHPVKMSSLETRVLISWWVKRQLKDRSNKTDFEERGDTFPDYPIELEPSNPSKCWRNSGKEPKNALNQAVLAINRLKDDDI